jgi:hypothetical protein
MEQEESKMLDLYVDECYRKNKKFWKDTVPSEDYEQKLFSETGLYNDVLKCWESDCIFLLSDPEAKNPEFLRGQLSVIRKLLGITYL